MQTGGANGGNKMAAGSDIIERECCSKAALYDEQRAEITRLRGIEDAAILVNKVVRRTSDHTEWFDALAKLMRALEQSQSSGGS